MLKIDRTIFQQVADIVRLEVKFDFCTLAVTLHICNVANSGHFVFSGDIAELAITIKYALIEITEI